MKRSIILTTFVAVACAFPCILFAEQFVLFDGELTFSTATGGRICSNYDGPHNWTSPTNYAGGTIYRRAKVLSKPTDLQVTIQQCKWSNGEMCEVCGITFSTPGEYFAKECPSTDWWALSNRDFSYIDNIWIVLKRQHCGDKWLDPCGGSWCVGAEATQHLPITMHYTAIIVSAGDQLDLPDEYDWECPADWNCRSSTVIAHDVAQGGKNGRLPPRHMAPTAAICYDMCGRRMPLSQLNKRGVRILSFSDAVTESYIVRTVSW